MIENYLKLKEKIKNTIYKSMKNDERIIIKLPSVWFLFTLSNLFSISFLNIIPSVKKNFLKKLMKYILSEGFLNDSISEFDSFPSNIESKIKNPLELLLN